ncbi:MAG: hypothetical protein SV487_08080, partial [Thermodesulfobacteriota bacterium]|nr:hypothetical protein [Thermodesulfobacteriota bacterium]
QADEGVAVSVRVYKKYQAEDPYSERVKVHGSTSGNVALSFSDGAVHTVTAGGNITFSLTNWPKASAYSDGLSLVLTNGGAYTMTWPAEVDWPGGDAPSLTESGVDRLVFISEDGGTTIQGFLAGADLS